MKNSKKPIYPVLPSLLTAAEEVKFFLSKGRINFPDEATLGLALSKVYHGLAPQSVDIERPTINAKQIRTIIGEAENGYLAPEKVQALLDAAGIKRAGEEVAEQADDAVAAANRLGYPVVMKVVGPVHKSDVGGVVLHVKNAEQVRKEFERMIRIKDTTAILLQPMLSGLELFAGAKKEGAFGHTILCGMGGIFIEVLKDVAYELVPVDKSAALKMIESLKSYPLLQGVRGQKPIQIEAFAETISRLSALLEVAPEIAELDLNPLLANEKQVIAVDARVRIEK
jgi:acetyltransferase